MKKRFWQKSLSVCLALLMTEALFPAQFISVSAESGVPYIDRHWDDDMEAVQSEIRYCTSYSWLSGDEDEDLYSGWYVTKSGSRFNSSERLYVHGTVNIILTDGVTLECLDGINVPSGSTLNIYGQINGTGELKAIADTNHVAAIGGDDRQSNGTINIYGGKVTAKADVDAAGIGSGDDAHAGNINIYGGTVNATGGSTNSDGGAGIGGGNEGNGGTITITNGNVTAKGGCDAAGIGGGDNAESGTISITNGTVNATGGDLGAGIGGGDGSSGSGGKIRIGGGEVTTTGGSNGAGIGGGNCGDGGNIEISGGKVKSTGGSNYSDTSMGYYDGAAGIGGGYQGDGGDILISGGEVEATSGYQAAGIGGGNVGVSGNIKITGGTVRAIANASIYGAGGAGIGDGRDRISSAPDRTIQITGGNVYAQAVHGTSIEGGAGIGAGYNGKSGNLSIIIDDCEKVDARGANDSKIGSITINGGTVNAYGGNYAAGIGGGYEEASGKITINGGTVNADSSSAGAGIGSGAHCTDSNAVDVTINGGSVNAKGGGVSDDYIRYTGRGAGIGVGGCDYKGDEIFHNSIFNGSITFNGGVVTCNTDEGKCVAVGMDESTLVEDSEGKVYFNGATVRMETTDATPSVRAREVYIKDDSSTHLSVSYKENDRMITVVKANRLCTIQSAEKTYVEVKPCTHENISYESLGSEQHHASCASCGVNYDEAHIIGEPTVWNWADNHSAATAVFLCPCGYSFNIQTTSIEVKDYFNKNVYTANVEYSGKTYTNTVEVNKSSIVITNESDWGKFIQTVNDGTTFAGQTITLTNDISVTTMAGTDTHKFMGTFEGGGHTITFDYTADEDRAAPFRYVDGATFKDLKVTGTITTSASNAAGFVADAKGTTTFDSCWSNIAIVSTVKGDGTHGGFVARSDNANSNTVFVNCLFDGSISGNNTTHCGGLLGWPYDKNVSFTNCLNIGTFTTKTTGCGTFSRVYDSSKLTITSSYYKTAYGTEQGTQTNATGNELKALLGKGWLAYGNKVVPACFTITPLHGRTTTAQ